MADDFDRYDAWYSEKLWQRLPAIYRAEDSDDFDRRGPLREIVERIGAQAAVVRRSIDRLWEDQSIESCDDWIIDYIGELLATNLVASLDARGRRLDVARTIYYRRRKGTVPLLEELAGDITGWGVRVVELFRRMERTRHGLDPAIGLPATGDAGTLQRAQGLIGERTSTRPGGYADLRSVHGAALTNTAFDEYAHTADVRRGRGATGRYNIPHLGVFLWRLKSFAISGVTAVQDEHCRNQYTFDPTGRDIPLFAADDRQEADDWISPAEYQMPGPISRPLFQHAFAKLYRDEDHAHSLAVHRFAGVAAPPADYELVDAGGIESDPRQPTTKLCIDPTRGRIIAPVAQTTGKYRVDYHYGFASEIGAGPYDRRIVRAPRERSVLPATPSPEVRVREGVDLDRRLADLVTPVRTTGTAWIEDSLTYDRLLDVAKVEALAIRARNFRRPLMRSEATKWVFHGKGDSSTLELDGLFVGGGTDIVLEGNFAHVKLSCCTLDPGSWDGRWLVAADGRELTPSALRIEGSVRVLELDRCIVGPLADVDDHAAARIEIRDSIVHAAHPKALALSLTHSTLALERCTILGRGVVHRLDASESILHGRVEVEDQQHGCVRFSAYTSGSKLPKRYESVAIEPGEDLFASRAFGRPAYAQLVTTNTAIVEGAEDGSEMGAFCREKSAIKERGLLVKYQEYLPLGIEPVIVHVT